MVARNNKYNKPATDERWRHVHLSLNFLELLKGVNLSDQCVKDTLKVKYEVDLTEKELLDFVNYLIAHNPQYPSSSEREHSKSGKRICLYKKPEVFQQAYLEYKATKKRCFIFQIPGSLRLAVLYLINPARYGSRYYTGRGDVFTANYELTTANSSSYLPLRCRRAMKFYDLPYLPSPDRV